VSTQVLNSPFGALSATSGTSTQAYLPDALGSVLALVNSAGLIATSYSYNIFGAATSSAGASDPNPERYTGLMSGQAMPAGLQDNNARDYSPATGRFISADPMGTTGSGDNLYAYANDDAADNSDPSGEEVPELIACAIGGVVNDIGGALDGRKHSFGDYFAGAGLGCLGGFLMTIPGGDEALEALEAGDFGMLGTDGSEDLSLLEDDLAGDGTGEDGLGEGACDTSANSFASDTKITLPSGKTIAISKLKPGDRVLATDPATGRTSAEPVMAVIRGHKVEHLVTVKIRTGAGRTGSIVVTAGHPFYDVTRHAFVAAGRLRAHDRLKVLGPGSAVVVSVRAHRPRVTTAYNLMIGTDHTYYVTAANTAVLVHNCAAASQRRPWEITQGGTAARAYSSRFGNFYKSASDGLWWSKDLAGHGGSVWKVFKETPQGLDWIADADQYGDFIVGKWKGGVGRFIPWKDLSMR